MAKRSKIDAYIEELVRYSSATGQSAYGEEPIDMTPMAYASGALHALERTGAISESQLHEAIDRCHAAHGLKPPGRLAAEAGTEVFMHGPEWADHRPKPVPRDPRDRELTVVHVSSARPTTPLSHRSRRRRPEVAPAARLPGACA